MTSMSRKHVAQNPGVSVIHDARELVPDGVSALIDLDGQVYVLRITRAGKLILTK